MDIIPSRKEFLRSTEGGSILPLYAELDAASVTPLSALHALRPLGHPVLLESARVNERTGRYSFVTADPYLVFRSTGDTIEIGRAHV
jgi:anthranilate synthase component 1